MISSKSMHLRIRNCKNVEALLRIDGQKTKWTSHKTSEKYWNFRDAISCIDGFLYKNNKLIAPRSMRSQILKTLYSSHLWIAKCRASSGGTPAIVPSVYWPVWIQRRALSPLFWSLFMEEFICSFISFKW